MVTMQTWIDAQSAVLGSCLIEDECAAKIVFGLQESDFVEEYRTLYKAIRDLYTTGKPVDPITVMSIAGDGFKDLIRQLIEITPSARNIDHYIAITAEQSRVMKMRDIGTKLETVDSVEEAQRILDSANGTMVKTAIKSYSLFELLKDFFKRYANPPDYLDWFIPEFRKKIRLKSGNYMIIAARPSVGKTTIALQAAAFWSIALGKRVGFYSDEMDKDEVCDKLLCMFCGVGLEDIQERRLSRKQMQQVGSIARSVAMAPLDVNPASANTVADIRAHALQQHYDIVVIDYLQIVPDSGADEYTRVTNVTNAIRAMAKDTGITVLALCQLSRIKGVRPVLEDLRSSGQLEQDADIVAFLHRPNDDVREDVEFIIAKNRNGPLGNTKLFFEAFFQRFLYVGRGNKPIKPFDYAKCKRPELEPDRDLDQLPMSPEPEPDRDLDQLPMSTEVPF